MKGNEPGIHIHIRRATADDAVSIASVMHTSFVEYESAYAPEAFAATTPTPEQVQHRMSEGPMWVALQDDTIVGTVSVVPNSASLYIRGMAILPSARGQSIVPLLLEWPDDFLSQHSYAGLFFRTTPFL